MTKQQKQLKEIARLQKLHDEYIASLEAIRDNAIEEIDTLLEGKSLFCGIILTNEDIANIIKVKLANPTENIKLKYNIYIQEDEVEDGSST